MSERSPCFEAITGLHQLPETLYRRLLREHGVGLSEAGVDLEHVDPNGLWDARSELPAGFVDAVHRIHDMSDPTGHDQLLSVSGGPLFLADGAGLSSIALAAHTLLYRPELFNRAHGRRFVEALRKFQEFPGRLVTDPTWTDDALARIQARLAFFFAGRGRSTLCRIRPWSEVGTRHFMVSHGRHARTDDAVREHGGTCSEVTLSWRPQQHDLVVYDVRTGRLRISAPDAHIVREYLAAFGELLFGDPGWFAHGTIVSLAPLMDARASVLTPTPGLIDVKLVELEVATRLDHTATITFRGDDVFRALADIELDPSAYGPLRQAKLRLRFKSDARWRTVSVASPDRVTGDWRREGGIVRRYLEERGILSGPPPLPAEGVA